MQKPEFIHLDQCNFEDYLPGGTLSFTRQMRKAFGNRMALAGIVTDDTPCGQWIEERNNGMMYQFLGIGRVRKQSEQTLMGGV